MYAASHSRLTSHSARDDFTAAVVEGALLADFEPDQLQDRSQEERKAGGFVRGARRDAERRVDRGRILGEAQNFTRDLVNEPANVLTPMPLAERAREMAAEARPGMRGSGSGSHAAAGHGRAAGSGAGQRRAARADRDALQAGATPASTKDHLGLVGKGVTFDTGGISIKPSDGMEKMKYDMSGGAAVLGAMRAIAQLKPAIPVTALVPAVENMPGSQAQRPGDIVKTLSGQDRRSAEHRRRRPADPDRRTHLRHSA